MRGIHPFVKYWLPVALWMAVIFFGSTSLFSNERTSRFIGPLLRWLNPAISDQAIRQVQIVLRKGAHLAEYAVLSVLVWRALRRPQPDEPRPWTWAPAALALVLAALYAITDEYHQSLVGTRWGSPWDVGLDSLGAAAGMLVLWKSGWWRRIR